jgi:hypothetical protein
VHQLRWWAYFTYLARALSFENTTEAQQSLFGFSAEFVLNYRCSH